MARIQQRLNRLEDVTPQDKERSTATWFLRLLECWQPEQTLIEDGDDSTAEQVTEQCLRLAEQVRAGEVEFTLSAMVRQAPSAMFCTLDAIDKRSDEGI